MLSVQQFVCSKNSDVFQYSNNKCIIILYSALYKIKMDHFENKIKKILLKIHILQCIVDKCVIINIINAPVYNIPRRKELNNIKIYYTFINSFDTIFKRKGYFEIVFCSSKGRKKILKLAH